MPHTDQDIWMEVKQAVCQGSLFNETNTKEPIGLMRPFGGVKESDMRPSLRHGNAVHPDKAARMRQGGMARLPFTETIPPLAGPVLFG
jgi:hypothetical protein